MTVYGLAFRVPCPTCGAAQGKKCVNRNTGTERSFQTTRFQKYYTHHAARLKAARDLRDSLFAPERVS